MNEDEIKVEITVIELRAVLLLAVAGTSIAITEMQIDNDHDKCMYEIQKNVEEIIKSTLERKRD